MKVKKLKVYKVFILTCFLLLASNQSFGQIVKEFQKFRDTTYVNDKSTINTRIDSVISEIPDSANVGGLINDSLDVAKSVIYDSLNTRIDSVLGYDYSKQIIEGWYEQDVASTGTSIYPLSKGVGNMDNMFETMSPTIFSKLGMRVSEILEDNPLTVYLYKNGYNTGAKLVLNVREDVKKITSFGDDVVTFTEEDYFDLRYNYEGSQLPDVKAFVELKYPNSAKNFEYQDLLTLTLTPVDSGSIQCFTISDGAVLDSGQTSYNLGDSVMLVARSNVGYDFICWKGFTLIDENQRVNDTCYIVMTSTMEAEARFRNSTRTYWAIISDPMLETTDGGVTYIDDADSSHAKRVRDEFIAGHRKFGSTATYPILPDDILIVEDATLTKTTFNAADNYGAVIVVRSANGSQVSEPFAQKYYPTLTVMPTGGQLIGGEGHAYNTNGELPCIVLTGYASGRGGAVTDTNTSTWDVEWLDQDSATSGYTSYSNGFIAGELLKLMRQRIYLRQETYNPVPFFDWYGLREVILHYDGDDYSNKIYYSNKNGYYYPGVYSTLYDIGYNMSIQSAYYNTLIGADYLHFIKQDKFLWR